jgi:hypothetical protein
VTFAATLSRLVQKYGHAHTLKRVTKGAYDPATGTAAETIEEEEITAVPLRPGQTNMAGSLIVREKAGVLIPGLDDTGSERAAPNSDDRIVDSLTGAESEIGAVDALVIQGGFIGWACDLGR